MSEGFVIGFLNCTNVFAAVFFVCCRHRSRRAHSTRLPKTSRLSDSRNDKPKREELCWVPRLLAFFFFFSSCFVFLAALAALFSARRARRSALSRSLSNPSRCACSTQAYRSASSLCRWRASNWSSLSVLSISLGGCGLRLRMASDAVKLTVVEMLTEASKVVLSSLEFTAENQIAQRFGTIKGLQKLCIGA